MRLLSLTLEQYRSHAKEEIRFAPGDVHALMGPNGAGKTTILEAIGLLSLAKSFQGAEEQDLCQWGTDFYRVRAGFLEDTGEERTLEVVSQQSPRSQKVCFVNDVRTPVLQFVGRLPTVSFLPQDLSLFIGPPLMRRRFLDQLLCQVSPEYLQTLMEYQKILKQRNALLRKIAEGTSFPSELDVWDAGLSERGGRLTLDRLELTEMLQCTLREELSALGESWVSVHIVYERSGAERTQEGLQAELLQLLRQARERDTLLQATGAGPHRDDWRIEVEGRSLPTFASRGQQRTAVLALLFLQVSYLELRRGEKPVVLLDDVFSELDARHQAALLQSLGGHQVILTTTHLPQELYGAAIYDVGDGRVACRRSESQINKRSTYGDRRFSR